MTFVTIAFGRTQTDVAPYMILAETRPTHLQRALTTAWAPFKGSWIPAFAGMTAVFHHGLSLRPA
jgi:hypothetical protein